ncbi:MAG: sensor histidine kinase [Bacteroidia bacterium]|nr:sensor histidine kinase [Bacteroidia bacterium]
MIRNPTPQRISLLTSAALSTVVCGILFFLHAPVLDFLSCLFLFFSLSYLTFLYALDVFIYRKIKIIYKNIHDFKVTKINRKNFQVDLDMDPIKRVNDEVMDWARNQSQEISFLKQQEVFRRDFLGNVSHELKTPVFSLQGYIETLLDGALYDETVNEVFLKKAAKSADRINSLVNDLLEISQLESGSVNLQMIKWDVCELTHEIFESLETQAVSNSVELTIKEGCDKPFMVMADREKIRQVLTNLTQNAINYGKNKGKVSIGFYDMDANILIEIADEGEGIAKEHLPRLFERFYRVDRSRSRDSGGTGLGLAIVKHIIEAHQQTINVRSTLRQGTTFGFTLAKAK